MNETAPKKTTRRRKRPDPLAPAAAGAGLGAARADAQTTQDPYFLPNELPTVEELPTAPAPAREALRPERPPVRTPMREDPRAAADARAQEILGHLGSMDEGRDEFAIDKRSIPDGWEYEWKRKSVLGMEDPAYQVGLARTGWTEVPARRHPEMMPKEWTSDTIERKGMVLMERPKEISDLVRNRDNVNARNQVRVKEEQLSSAPSKGHMPRAGDPGGDARTRPIINKGYEPMPIPGK